MSWREQEDTARVLSEACRSCPSPQSCHEAGTAGRGAAAGSEENTTHNSEREHIRRPGLTKSTVLVPISATLPLLRQDDALDKAPRGTHQHVNCGKYVRDISARISVSDPYKSVGRKSMLRLTVVTATGSRVTVWIRTSVV